MRSPSTPIQARLEAAGEKTQPWLWFNLLSLDAPVIAVLWQQFLAYCLQVQIAVAESAALGLSVWLIYVVDRLLDARSTPEKSSARHRFHQQHRGVLTSVAGLGAVTLLFVCAQLERSILWDGCCLSLLMLVYFCIVHATSRAFHRFWSKEFTVGILFAAGTFLVPSAHTRVENLWVLILVSFCFAALCGFNCVAIEYWEWDRFRDVETPPALASWVGLHLPSCFGIFLLLTGMAAILSPAIIRPLLSGLMLSTTALLLLDRFRTALSVEAVRVLADASLLSPVPVLLILHWR